MWTKLSKRDNWGKISYFDGEGTQVKFSDRQRVNIRLPDSGITTKGQIHARTEIQVVGDCGRKDVVYSTVYEVIYNSGPAFGFEIVPVETVEVWID